MKISTRHLVTSNLKQVAFFIFKKVENFCSEGAQNASPSSNK
jgi:hypothetical protein